MDLTWDPLKERRLLIFILPYHGYTHVVPFVIGRDEMIVLKTAFPSRKFHQQYGKANEIEA